jgi:hypothetical protein
LLRKADAIKINLGHCTRGEANKSTLHKACTFLATFHLYVLLGILAGFCVKYVGDARIE